MQRPAGCAGLSLAIGLPCGRARRVGIDANERIGPALMPLDRRQRLFKEIDGADRARREGDGRSGDGRNGRGQWDLLLASFNAASRAVTNCSYGCAPPIGLTTRTLSVLRSRRPTKNHGVPVAPRVSAIPSVSRIA